MTDGSSPSGGAATLETPLAFRLIFFKADTAIETWIASINRAMAVWVIARPALPAIGTAALEVRDEIHAGPVLFAGILTTFVNVFINQNIEGEIQLKVSISNDKMNLTVLAVRSIESLRADAVEGTDSVDARPAISARVIRTVINVYGRKRPMQLSSFVHFSGK